MLCERLFNAVTFVLAEKVAEPPDLTKQLPLKINLKRSAQQPAAFDLPLSTLHPGAPRG
jgi:hypothetical protein